jgi:hypothetical protein
MFAENQSIAFNETGFLGFISPGVPIAKAVEHHQNKKH